jgi:hypothetical protein
MTVSTKSIRVGRLSIALPRNRAWRITLGAAICFLGLFGFLPVLGFWMVPLGLLILSGDVHFVRRKRRQAQVRWGRWLNGHQPSLARRFGYSGR